MSGNTESVTESVKGGVTGSATGGGGTAGVTGPEVTGAETADLKGHEVTGHDTTGHDVSGHDVSGHDVTGREAKGHDVRGHEAGGAGIARSAVAATGVAGAGAVPALGVRGGEAEIAGARGGATTVAGAREAGPGSAPGGARGAQTAARAARDDERLVGIGARLAKAREATGLTVAELSRITRIREPVIRAIEHDDFSVAGGDFYARGHIRNIARTIGIDPEPLVHEYDDQHGGVPIPVRAAEVFLAEIPIKLRERRTFNWTTAMAAVLVMVVAFGVVRLMSGSGDVDSTGLRQGTPAAKPPGPSGAPANAASPRRHTSSATPLVAADTVVLRVTADRPTRLTVRDGKGKRLFRGTFPAGSSSEWQVKDRIDVTASDGGAVRLEVNGKDLGTAGPSGEKVTRTFGPNTPGMR